MAKPFAWSYSALTMFEQCPKKHYHLQVVKDFKDADSSWSADGKVVHDAMKKRVIDGVPFPLPMRHYEAVAAKFAGAKGEKHGEMKLALTSHFKPCDYFAPDVWVRVIIDLAIVQGTTAIVADWKTGKIKDDPTQNGLCAAVLAQWMPELTDFTTLFVWLQSGKLTKATYTRESIKTVWAELLPRVQKMELARKYTDFPAQQSGLCGYCPVHTCPHYKPRG
jgi:hypothetical protein